jgi:hypothetical protein
MQYERLALATVFLVSSAAPAFAQPVSTEAWWAATDPSGRQIVHIHCGQDFLDPKEVVVKRNVPVWMAVRAAPTMPPGRFGFTDPGLPGKSPVKGEATVVEFVPRSLGRFAMGCEPESGPSDAPNVKARKQGVLTVVQ